MEYTISSIAPIFLLPFSAFVVLAFFGRKLPRKGDFIAVGSVFLSFIYALRIFKDFIFNKYSAEYHVHKVFTWFDLSFGDVVSKIDMGIYLDNMSAIMLLMVTGAATLILLFSTYYMKGDVRYGRFFTYMSLFTSAMLGLVLSDNLLSVFIFWEIMGFCSYSLIGFYYEKEKAGNASLKAFMTTRIGDVFFLLGIAAIWSVVGNVTFVDIYRAIAAGSFEGLSVLGIALTSFAGFCVFMGTIGKSAQFPLQVWLPDAMMGPTPCSALIHAATMVAAGVYLSLRMYPLMVAGGLTPFIAYIGAITAFGAATIALIQTDIKAVLAFSTISQLGYMVLGIGVGSYNAAFMHLITHAVFKACLFLSAGSVIHSLHDHHTHGHVQEMPRMGGLRKKMPFTFIAMMACTLAISGIPFFSGFVSKDRILGDALYFGFFNSPQHALIPILGFAAAILTAFYMFRMMFLTFFGKPRDKELYDHCHQEKLSFNRNIPLLILSIFTLGVFFSGSLTGQGLVKIFPDSKFEWFQTLVTKPDIKSFSTYQRSAWSTEEHTNHQHWEHSHYHAEHNEDVHHAHVYGALISIFIAFLGLLLAFLMYIRHSLSPSAWVERFHGWYKGLQNKYYFDDFYIKGIIQKGLLRLNNLLSRFDLGFYDKYAIDGWQSVNRWFFKASRWFDDVIVDTALVDGSGTSVRAFNLILRVLQSGKIQFYFLVAVIVLASYICAL